MSAPEYGTEDYRRHAVLFNDITHAPHPSRDGGARFAPIPFWRVQWQPKGEPPAYRDTRREPTAERMAKALRLRGMEVVVWPVVVWEVAA